MKPLSKTYKKLGIDFTFPIKITDANGNRTYYENSSGWYKSEYDANGKETYYEDSHGIILDHGAGRASSEGAAIKDGTVLEINGQKYELKLTTQ